MKMSLIRLRKGETLTIFSEESKEMYTFICLKDFLGFRKFKKEIKIDLPKEIDWKKNERNKKKIKRN